MTPSNLAKRIVDTLPINAQTRVLEPSFGDGSFLLPLIERLVDLHDGTPEQRLAKVLTKNIFGIEIDEHLRQTALGRISSAYGQLPSQHNLDRGDFFRKEYLLGHFDLVVGNPPFGGTFDPQIENRLDRLYGKWDGHKLKKETYSFFIARSLDWLADGGSLHFISSDTFLTIKTMGGLRRRLMDQCAVEIETISQFSDETQQPTLVLRATRDGRSESLNIDGTKLDRSLIETTGNFSWRVDESMAPYFGGPELSAYIVATGGMTIGKNELFVRELRGGEIIEPYEFDYFDDPITLRRELERARLNQLSPKKQSQISEMEAAGVTRRNVRITPRSRPLRVPIPSDDYKFYNKARSEMVYAPPRWVVYWKDSGEAVLTFKKNGNWYLHGVGGQKYFGRAGMTWQLVAPRLKVRYLPEGYVLDSGAPCAFLREGVPDSEFWFIFAWLLTPTATKILKTVINHTRNIQGKDVERLPYPHWVDQTQREEAAALVGAMVADAIAEERTFDHSSPEIEKLDVIFRLGRG